MRLKMQNKILFDFHKEGDNWILVITNNETNQSLPPITLREDITHEEVTALAIELAKGNITETYINFKG